MCHPRFRGAVDDPKIRTKMRKYVPAQWRDLLQPEGGPSDHREMACPLQHSTATLGPQLQAARTPHNHTSSSPPRPGVQHAITSHRVWYRKSVRPARAHGYLLTMAAS